MGLVSGYIRTGSGWHDGLSEITNICLLYHDDKTHCLYDLILYDEEYESLEIPMPSQTHNLRLFDKIYQAITLSQKRKLDCYATLLECPMVIGTKVVKIQMVRDV